MTSLSARTTHILQTIGLRRGSRLFLRHSSGAAWTPAHKPGEFPLYDLALRVIEEDSERIRGRLKEIKKTSLTAQTLARMQELEVFSELNRPETLWAFEQGKGDMSKPVFRHLAERRWRDEGKLDHLMQRIHTMNIVPDLVGDIHPSVDLDVVVGDGSIEAGVFVDPQATVQAPGIGVKVFHREERSYTLVMVDPDVPDVPNRSYRQYLHWLIPNVVISSTSPPLLQLENFQPACTYLPPHPQNGTPYHRYTVLLLENPESRELPITPVSESERATFCLRDFIKQWDFKPSLGGGIHFWRSTWTPSVSDIYSTILHKPEPRYGRPPKIDRYEEVKRTRRYI
ncbi:SubName: Full=Related to MRPL35-mitochondrial ribosomal protein, large subunit {ECO:0000313/EMBL:CCA68605.1} [Serendipita indica DSM 11827]|nr:SubName: Full=Related to MRPL35-mitochondrial ribosomal protein, large subunit {ECO:0000313/EMBL:CCA68605.1} [Serendipita indica DSM 11827]